MPSSPDTPEKIIQLIQRADINKVRRQNNHLTMGEQSRANYNRFLKRTGPKSAGQFSIFKEMTLREEKIDKQAERIVGPLTNPKNN